MAELPKAAQGTFDELLAGVEPGLAAIARRLRAVIRAVDVSTVEQWSHSAPTDTLVIGAGLCRTEVLDIAEGGIQKTA